MTKMLTDREKDDTVDGAYTYARDAATDWVMEYSSSRKGV